MLKLYNTVMKTYMNMPDHYAGVFPFVEAPEEVAPIQENLEGYKVAPVDADNDGYIQDGTDFERPVDTEMTKPEQKAAVLNSSSAKKARKTSK
jgi:hypothetical protein